MLKSRDGTKNTVFSLGFVLNRMQYALLNECWRLVASGVVTADDLDVVMRDGLGLRYAIMGPMETIHLRPRRRFEREMMERSRFAAINRVSDKGAARRRDREG